MTIRLPVPGSDRGAWGDELNAFLEVSHNSDGTLIGSQVQSALGGSSSVLYVSATGNDSADGKAWGSALATINAAITALGTTGGVIYVGAGTFAPFTIDSSAAYKRGITIRGVGPRATVILATAAGQDACRVIGSDSTSPSAIRIEDLALTGTTSNPVTGHGLNLGDGTWAQLGTVQVRNVRIETNGGDGIHAFDLNECHFDTLRIRSNGGHGVYITGASADGTGSVALGNTNIFENVGLYSNGADGYHFNAAGNSYTIIGGEVHTQASGDGFVIVPSGSTVGYTLIGVHFESNQRGAHLGDNNASGGGLATNVEFLSCHFTGTTGSDDVYLDGVNSVSFENCEFGATNGVHVSNTAQNRYYLRRCKTAGTNLIKDRNGTLVSGACDDYSWGGRRRITNDTAGHADAISTAIDYVKNTQAAADYLEYANASGTLLKILNSGLIKWAAAGNVQTTVGSAGAASALPSSPTKYLKVVGDDGVTYVIPAFAAS